MMHIPPGWRNELATETEHPYFQALKEFLKEERASHEVYPPEDQVFTALKLAPFKEVRVVILGQDPYHDEGQAHGLAFSVLPGVTPPPSLRNIFKELESDLGIPRPKTGCLIPWARQGVLLLNAVLTVRAHQPNSHHGKGWEQFTDAVLRHLNKRTDPIVFVFWGAPAQKKKVLIETPKHHILMAPHPSPLSAKRGFFGSKPFSTINSLLEEWGTSPIDWRLD